MARGRASIRQSTFLGQKKRNNYARADCIIGIHLIGSLWLARELCKSTEYPADSNPNSNGESNMDTSTDSNSNSITDSNGYLNNLYPILHYDRNGNIIATYLDGHSITIYNANRYTNRRTDNQTGQTLNHSNDGNDNTE